jgi:O-antigen/teichoic acid export membrane protein
MNSRRESADKPHSSPTVGTRSAARTVLDGVGWLLAQNAGGRIIGLACQFLLAKLLLPGDFGVLGLAGTVTSVVGVLVWFGVDDVLLQRQKTMRFWITPAFWMSLGSGTLGMTVVLVVATVMADAYSAPELKPILSIMAIAMPFAALVAVPTVIIRASLNFRLLAVLATVELIAIQALTILLASRGFGPYSFAIPVPIIAVGRCATFWWLARPKLGRLRMWQFKYIGWKSAAVFGTRVLTTCVGQADYFVLGLIASKEVVGIYYFAFRLAVQPVQMLAGNLSNVLFPVLVQMRDDPVRQRSAALNASRFLSYLVMPYSFLQAAVADPLLHWMFGSKWEPAIPILQVLSIGLGFDAVSWIAGALLSARGEFNRLFKLSCVFSPLFVLGVWRGAMMGSALGVAVAVALFYSLMGPIFTSTILLRSGFVKEVLDIYLKPVLLSAVSIGGAYLLSMHVPIGYLFRIVVMVVVGPGLYALLLFIVDPDTSRQMADRARGLIAGANG